MSQKLSGRISTEVRRLRTENLIALKSGWFYGVKSIQGAVLDLKHEWTQEMKMQIRAYMPPGTGGGGLQIPYRTGRMSNAFHRTLNNSPEGRIWLGAGTTPYAGFVDAFTPPIHWTTPGSVYQWFRKVFKFMEGIIMPTLKRVIRKIGLAQTMNQSVSTLSSAVEPA